MRLLFNPDDWLPPTSLAWIVLVALLAGGGAGTGMRRVAGRWVAMLALLGLVVLGLPAVSLPMLAALDVPEAEVPVGGGPGPPAAIVILSADVQRTGTPGLAAIGPMTLERERAGAALARRTGLPVLVTGGIVSMPPAVAGLMATSMASDFGVAVRWAESRSGTTWENAEFSVPILRRAGIQRVFLVTHAWHMRRSLLAFPPGRDAGGGGFGAVGPVAIPQYVGFRAEDVVVGAGLSRHPRVGGVGLVSGAAGLAGDARVKDGLLPLEALGPEWDGVLAAGEGVQSRLPWFEATAAAALGPGEQAGALAVWRDGRPLGLLPVAVEAGGRARSLTTMYTTEFQPLVAVSDAGEAGAAWGQLMRRWGVVVLEAMDPGWAGLAPFLAGVRRAGLVVWTFEHFGNWHEEGIGSWEGYLAGRPGALRETLRRRGRAAARDASIRVEVVREPDGVEAALAAYEAVYARSWKVPEPYRGFNEAVLQRLAAMGVLRLGVMWRGAEPLAAQYWTVQDGRATVLKLAHDEGVKGLSPGSLLTAHMIRLVLSEGVTALDFGRGDDPYKKDWVGERRQRVGVVVANPRRVSGMLSVMRRGVGQVLRRVRG